jgi:hypothetical protein
LYSQHLNKADSVSRQKAAHVLKKEFGNSLQNTKHLLYSINDQWYLVVIEWPGFYEEFCINADSVGYKIKNKMVNINKPNRLLQKAFDPNSYHKDFINTHSAVFLAGYRIAEGKMTYFYLMDKKGKRFGETHLPILTKPNPIDTNIINYVRSKLLDCFHHKE